jgi:hypothetical protein
MSSSLDTVEHQEAVKELLTLLALEGPTRLVSVQ